MEQIIHEHNNVKMTITPGHSRSVYIHYTIAGEDIVLPAFRVPLKDIQRIVEELEHNLGPIMDDYDH